jgi:hypothetical protein
MSCHLFSDRQQLSELWVTLVLMSPYDVQRQAQKCSKSILPVLHLLFQIYVHLDLTIQDRMESTSTRMNAQLNTCLDIFRDKGHNLELYDATQS